jgi:hypothetical protein
VNRIRCRQTPGDLCQQDGLGTIERFVSHGQFDLIETELLANSGREHSIVNHALKRFQSGNELVVNKTPPSERNELIGLCMKGKGYRYRQVS